MFCAYFNCYLLSKFQGRDDFHLNGFFVAFFFSNRCRNAFGPSSGTVCLSGLLIAVVRMVRTAVDGARHEDATGMVNIVLRCCVNTFLAAIDFLNKFTINFAAITGEAYCTSARMCYELLKRNLLSAVFVETVSTRLLAGIVFVISAIYAIIVSKSMSYHFLSRDESLELLLRQIFACSMPVLDWSIA